MEVLFAISCSPYDWREVFYGLKVNCEHLNFRGISLERMLHSAEDLFIFGGKKSKRFASLTNSCGSTTSMHIYFSVEWALVVKYILDVWNVKTTGCDVCANQDCRVFEMKSLTCVYFRHTCLESIKRLQTCSLLHLRVQAVVLDFQKTQDTRNALSTRDWVAKDDSWLSCLLLNVVKHINIFFITLATESFLNQGRWHAVLIGQIDNNWCLRSKFDYFTDACNGIFPHCLNYVSLCLCFLLVTLHRLNTTRSHPSLVINRKCSWANNVLNATTLQVLFLEVLFLEQV